MAKITFSFKTDDEMQEWLGAYYDGNGESEMRESFYANNEPYPEIVITEEYDNAS